MLCDPSRAVAEMGHPSTQNDMTGMAEWRFRRRASELNPDDIHLEHERAVDHALGSAADAAVALPDFLGEDVQPHAGSDLLAELAVFDPAEADKAGPAQI